MRRLPFLPTFFIALGVLFVIVLVIRLRRQEREAAPAATAATGSHTTAVRDVPTGTIVPAPAPAKPRARAASESHAQKKGRPVARQPAAAAPRTAPASPPPPAGKPPTPLMVKPSASQPARISHSQAARPPTVQPTAESSASKMASAQTSTDPDSDTIPPQLSSIEFAPPQIHDGEQTTVVVTAVDDLSGVRGISGTLGSPTGKAMQGFATQREGETDRWVGHITIPRDAEQGLWKVRFLNLSDNASNSVTLSDTQGTVPASAVLRVISSESDSTPPVLKNAWLDRRAMRGGEKNTLFVEASDDSSGVNLVSAVFQSPSKAARIGAGCRSGDGNVWQCEISAPACVDCGDWQLEQITLQDKANNLATFRRDNPIVQPVVVNIMGDSCDSNAPLLQSVIVDPLSIAPASGSAVVTITVVANGNSCGISGVSGQYTGPVAGSGGFFPLQSSGEGTWSGRIQLDPHAARGTWKINSIQLTDQGHNLRIYYATDPLLRNAVFQVR